MFKSRAERAAAQKYYTIKHGVGKQNADYVKTNRELFDGAVAHEEARRRGDL